MGVSCISVWKEAHGLGSQKALEAVTAGIVGLNGGTKSRWSAAITLLGPVQEALAAGAEDALVVSSPQFNGPVYVVLRQSKQILEAQAAIAHLVLRSGSHRARTRVIVEGTQHQVGDFSIRAGNLSGGGEYRGTLVQVQYCPTNSLGAVALAKECTEVLAAQSATSTGGLQLVEQPFLGWALPPEFGSQHAAVLICAAVAELVKWS